MHEDFIDFNIQKLLPHKLSEYSPALAAGDVDGNGLDDIIIGGNSYNLAKIFLQQARWQIQTARFITSKEKSNLMLRRMKASCYLMLMEIISRMYTLPVADINMNPVALNTRTGCTSMMAMETLK